MNLAINALPWREGDRVITTRHEHPGGLGPLFALRERLGVEVEMVDIGDGEDGERTVEAFRTALERPARAVVASHVLWTTGAVLPIARIGALARDAGAVTIIDGAQSAGAIPIDIESLGRGRVRHAGPEVAAGARGHGRTVGRRALADSVMPASAGVHLVRVLRPGPAGAPPGCPPVRVRVLPSPVGRRASPAAAGG